MSTWRSRARSKVSRLLEADRYTLAAGLALAVLFGVWLFTRGASLTHDEAVYVDVAQHLLRSDYYPGEVFLRHPPLGLGLLAGWTELGLGLQAWPLPWGIATVGLVAAALRARQATPWALAPLAASPAVVGMLGVTMYPPLATFLAFAGWAWASGRPGLEALAWNLAILTHELALLVLAFVLAPRIFRLVLRERAPGRALRALAPYPAALAWGGVMLAGIFVGSDPRGGVVGSITDPSPNVVGILAVKPFVSLVFLAVLAPLARWPDPDHPARGLTVAAAVAVVAAPFYRYLVALVPLAVIWADADPPETVSKIGPALLLAGSLLATGGALAATVHGFDSPNGADLPGLVDHREGASLLEDGETTVVRSPVSHAHVLRGEGWSLVSTGATAPDDLRLDRGPETVWLLRAETLPGLQELARAEPVDAALVPATWGGWIEELAGDGWTRAGTAGGFVRLEAPPSGG